MQGSEQGLVRLRGDSTLGIFKGDLVSALSNLSDKHDPTEIARLVKSDLKIEVVSNSKKYQITYVKKRGMYEIGVQLTS